MSDEDRVYLVDLDDCGALNEEGRFVTLGDDLYIKALEERAMGAVLELERVKAAKLEDIRIYGYTMKEVIAILEQHRDSSIDAIRAVISEERGRDLLVIRAFVERVEKRVESYSPPEAARRWLRLYSEAFKDELAKMEKEDNARTDD